jgi:hypothetical protein
VYGIQEVAGVGVTVQYSDRPLHLVQVCQYLFVSGAKDGHLFVLDNAFPL